MRAGLVQCECLTCSSRVPIDGVSSPLNEVSISRSVFHSSRLLSTVGVVAMDSLGGGGVCSLFAAVEKCFHDV